MSKTFKIGCSGYYYAAWRNTFYPMGLPASQWLLHYSTVFNTVELNGTFYRVPTLSTLKKYARQTPADFVFTVKMNKHITHILRLKQAREKILEFCDLMMEGLGEKLHNILYQLPPSFVYNQANLENVLHNIPASYGSVVEFRNASWWNKEVVTALQAHNLSFCNTDYAGIEQTYIRTSAIFYTRKHGLPKLFKSVYTTSELKEFATSIPPGAADVYVYFNNTWYDGAYKNASELIKMLESTND
ncbi:MAG TPA: DUF72 domain-containing protein [Flavobacteriales bacterium]|nr:DUF72 domain-containing protein [Flavobacteriales bacterium]